MTCATVKSQLPLAASGDLKGEELLQVQRHSDACPACAAELKGLQATLQTLTDAGPMAVAEVDVGAIYRADAAEKTRTSRRWRQTAFALAAAAVLLIGLFGLTQLEVRWEAQQLVIRWGNLPASEQKQPGPLVDPTPRSVPLREDTETRLARLEQLVVAVAENSQGMDVQFSQQQRRDRVNAEALNQLARQLEDLRQETRRDRAGLYAALNTQPTPNKE